MSDQGAGISSVVSGGLGAAASRIAQSLGNRGTGAVRKGLRSLPVATAAAAGRAAARAAEASGGSSSTASAGATGTAITSTDFLSLLVTEMKNQDPTQPTDPNAYIQQLVGVNSLQQLIAINGDLTPPTAAGGATPTGKAVHSSAFPGSPTPVSGG